MNAGGELDLDNPIREELGDKAVSAMSERNGPAVRAEPGQHAYALRPKPDVPKRCSRPLADMGTVDSRRTVLQPSRELLAGIGDLLHRAIPVGFPAHLRQAGEHHQV